MEHFWLLLSSQVQAEGNVTYLAYPKISTSPAFINSTRINIIELDVRWKKLAQKKQLKEFICKNNVKTIYFVDQPYFSWRYALLKMWGIKAIIIHDHTPGDRPRIGGWRRLIKKIRNALPALTADLVINVSPLMRERSIANGVIPGKKCISVQNGINPILKLNEIENPVKLALKLKEEVKLIISTGRVHPYKGFDFIIKTVALLRQMEGVPKFALIVVGDGPALPQLKDSVSQQDLGDCVFFLGFRPDVREILPFADIAIHASKGEGFSLSILEYMSAGLATLVPDIPSVKQAVNDGDTGLVYEPENPGALAQAIYSLLLDTTGTRQIGEKAKRATDTRYNLAQTSKEFLSAIERYSGC